MYINIIQTKKTYKGFSSIINLDIFNFKYITILLSYLIGQRYIKRDALTAWLKIKLMHDFKIYFVYK